MHSEDDQIVPYVAAGPLSAKLLKNGTPKTYKDFPHGMPTTHTDTIKLRSIGVPQAGGYCVAGRKLAVAIRVKGSWCHAKTRSRRSWPISTSNGCG